MIVKQTNTNKGGVGFLGLLQIAFIVLKLCGVIDWPWILVLTPVLFFICFVVICVTMIVGVSMWRERKN